MFNFQKLRVYQNAKELVKVVYTIIKSFPVEERFVLSDQLRRAVISVPSNISEGMNRIATKEQVHFIEIAYGSLMEVFCQLEIAKELGYIDDNAFYKAELLVETISMQLSSLRKTLMASLSKL